VHCLRFLRDAFRTRPDTIDFIPELAGYIKERLRSDGDLLAAKIAMEAGGLLPEEDAEPVLVQALQMRNPWVSETALHACRHLKRVGRNLDRGLFYYLRSIPLREFLHRNREIIFSLSLSDAFRGLRRYCILRSIDNRAFLVALVFLVFTSPVLAMAFTCVALFFISAPSGSALQKRFPWQTLWRAYFGSLIVGLSLSTLSGGPKTPGRWIRLLFPAPAQFEHKWPGIRRVLLPGVGLAHGSTVAYAVIIYLAVGVAVIPWVDVAFMFQRARWHVLFSLGTLKRLALVSATGTVVLVLIASLIAWLDPWLETHPLIEWIFFTFIIGFPVLANATRLTWLSYKDRRHLQNVTRSTALTRQLIAADFLQFRTPWYRTRYVEWLRNLQIQPLGGWNGSRPNIGNDVASTMLAQLDERWLAMES
jgi:hypothetical protein